MENILNVRYMLFSKKFILEKNFVLKLQGWEVTCTL